MPDRPQAGKAFTTFHEQVVAQTVDDSPTVVFSHPLALNKVAGVDAYVVIFDNVMDRGAAVRAEVVFIRRIGDVQRIAVPRPTLIVSSFIGPPPRLDLVANVSAQSIDVVVTGKVATILRWHLDLTLRQTT